MAWRTFWPTAPAAPRPRTRRSLTVGILDQGSEVSCDGKMKKGGGASGRGERWLLHARERTVSEE